MNPVERDGLKQQLMMLYKNASRSRPLSHFDNVRAGKILLQLQAASLPENWENELKELCTAIGTSTDEANRCIAAVKGGSLPTPVAGKTVHGYPMDVIHHVFQTSIRQGDEHRALQCMVELDVSGHADWMWKRMPIIACEDVGLSHLGLECEIEHLRVEWKRKRGDRFVSHRLFLAHAVLLLVRVRKSRLTDHALIAYYENQQPIEISEQDKQDALKTGSEGMTFTDNDYDKHTAEGYRRGRGDNPEGINHFFDVSAQLKNECPAIDDGYKERARQARLQKFGATRRR